MAPPKTVIKPSRRVFLGERYDLFMKPNGLWQIYDTLEGEVIKDNLTKKEALRLFSSWEFEQEWEEVARDIRSGKKVLF